MQGNNTYRRLITRVVLGCIVVCSSSALRAQATLLPHQARVVEIESLTHDVKRVQFRLINAKGFSFTPGQFVLLQVPEGYVKEWNTRYNTSQEDVVRAYSIASSARQLPLFDLIIKRVSAPPGTNFPPGLASTYIHDALKVGDVVRFSEPTGSLFLPKNERRPILIVAGGIGAAPFVSLLQYWFERKYNRQVQIQFFFGVRSQRDLFLHEKFLEWARTKKNFRYIPALSDPSKQDDWKGETGFINAVLDKYVTAPSPAEAYIAGPPIMIREVIKVLNAKGISGERIHHDPIEVK